MNRTEASGSVSATVEVLIPSWNRRELLREAVDACLRQTVPATVCVIDNDSDDGSREMLASEFPEVRVVRLDRNEGFGAALNHGVRTCTADVVAFLNNDTVADENFVEETLEVIDLTGAEMVAACLRRPDGTIDSMGVAADQSLVAYDHLHGERYPPPGQVDPPLGPTGGAAVFSRAAFVAVGGYDDSFFAYLEDLDLAIRMRLAGMRCAVAHRAFAWHRHAGTLGAGSAGKNRLMGVGRGRILWKHGASLPRRARLRGLAVDGVTYLGQCVFDRNAAAVRGRLQARRELGSQARPAPHAGFAKLPLLDLTVREALRQRWGRARRYRAGGAQT